MFSKLHIDLARSSRTGKDAPVSVCGFFKLAKDGIPRMKTGSEPIYVTASALVHDQYACAYFHISILSLDI